MTACMEVPRAAASGRSPAALVSVSVMSADHAESPGADADPAADLADVFIFPSPQNAGRTRGRDHFRGTVRTALANRRRHPVRPQRDLHLPHRPRRPRAAASTTWPTSRSTRDPAATAGANAACSSRTCPARASPCPGRSRPVFVTASGLKFFAGTRNDPFFFDAEGFTRRSSRPSRRLARAATWRAPSAWSRQPLGADRSRTATLRHRVRDGS